ncbi:MAG: flavodoxin-dependent (E)-4-hydroxy-3-methylbut-2-enyl-diphosphate synthase [Candidatus Omnitrophota bacterium]
MMQIKRRKTRVVRIGRISIGGGNPVAVQSMAKVKTSRVEEVLRQVRDLASAGCEIVRVAVKDEADARAIKAIKKSIDMPLVADIHFSHRLALLAVESGADKIRLNPGNVHKTEEVVAIARACRLHRVPIRVGLNSGSLKTLKMGGGKRRLARGKGLSDIMVKEALDYLKILEKESFYNIVLSLKGSHLIDTISAYRKMSRYCDYPFHLGVTASGLPEDGAVKSSIAIGALLLEGIGDTIRVSLSAPPAEEVRVARSILQSVGLRSFGYEIISCPTCGRCEVDLISKLRELKAGLEGLGVSSSGRPVSIALMGCVVNGPGEAREADIAVAFGAKEGLLFKKGKPFGKVTFRDSVAVLLRELKAIGCSGLRR